MKYYLVMWLFMTPVSTTPSEAYVVAETDWPSCMTSRHILLHALQRKVNIEVECMDVDRYRALGLHQHRRNAD